MGAHLSGGHDGAAEAVIDIAHPNGAVRSLVIGAEALGRVIDASRLDTLDALIGQPWTVLIDGG